MKQSKTVVVKKTIERGFGTCGWCEQQGKRGFASSEIKVPVAVLKDNFKLDWFRKGFFPFKKLYWATKHKEREVVDKTTRVLICDDCIKQLK